MSSCPKPCRVPRLSRALVRRVAAALSASLLCAASAFAQDAARGRELYETHCSGCHYQRVHDRDRAKSQVQSRADLRAQVERWAAQTRRSFAADELSDVTEYLNLSHYRMEK